MRVFGWHGGNLFLGAVQISNTYIKPLGLKSKRHALKRAFLYLNSDKYQFFSLSTILPAEIQGIMARSLAPTFSIWCSSLMRRVALNDG
jgi:hypothetical protein